MPASRPEAQCLQAVARRTVTLASLLGLLLGVGMALAADPVPKLFNPSREVLSALRSVYPIVILTQPVNALAFVLDGVLYGAGGFAYAAKVSRTAVSHSAGVTLTGGCAPQAMPVCAVPAMACMLLSQAAGSADARLVSVWLGLTVLMLMRSLTILLPWRLGRGPFKEMRLH